MRAIKFRGKDIKTREWLYGNLQVPSKEGSPYFMWDKDLFQCEVNPKTIGQFTGLYDKNHNEIYEGDILSMGWLGLLEVRFVRGAFAFLWGGDLDDEFAVNAPTHEWATIEGNIHDNPDML